MKKVKVSLIIVNHKAPEMTLESIKSIIKHSQKESFEIILVDNGSGIYSKRYFDKKLAGLKQVKTVYTGKNLGFGGGFNFGLKYARGEFVIIVSNDILFVDNAIGVFLKEYRRLSKKDKIALIQPKLYLNWQQKKLQHSAAKIPTLFQILQENFPLLRRFLSAKYAQFRYSDWDRKSSRFVECVCGASFFVKRSTWEKIGTFDQRFKVYFEEYDLGIRIKKLKLKNYYTDKTSFVHHHGKTPVSLIYKKWLYINSFIRFVLKYWQDKEFKLF